jgi:hypothetical protein
MMGVDWSWKCPAVTYGELYAELIGRRAASPPRGGTAIE